jgi:hypothetical protein
MDPPHFESGYLDCPVEPLRRESLEVSRSACRFPLGPHSGEAARVDCGLYVLPAMDGGFSL